MLQSNLQDYPNKSQCYECGELGHLSYKCSKNLLGEREPPPKKNRKRKKRVQMPECDTERADYFKDSDEEVVGAESVEEDVNDCETLSAAIAMEVMFLIRYIRYYINCYIFQREKCELEEYRYRVAVGDYTTTEPAQRNKKKIKKSSYFSDEEESE